MASIIRNQYFRNRPDSFLSVIRVFPFEVTHKEKYSQTWSDFKRAGSNGLRLPSKIFARSLIHYQFFTPHSTPVAPEYFPDDPSLLPFSGWRQIADFTHPECSHQGVKPDQGIMIPCAFSGFIGATAF
ncbi:hypothetical protein [Kosakonia cowanii]|uniref:hypothetical protein n=1 Tax=Kosakonia cowanii TaxID=208223 RepID=UPI001F5970CA|nr:hypothetical protein [Kosakonia cowanii]